MNKDELDQTIKDDIDSIINHLRDFKAPNYSWVIFKAKELKWKLVNYDNLYVVTKRYDKFFAWIFLSFMAGYLSANLVDLIKNAL